MAEIDKDVLESLAAKIDLLDLSDAERAVLDRLFERATAYEPEVEGFGMTYTGLQSGADLSFTSFKLASSIGALSPDAMMEYGGSGWPPRP